MPSSGVVRGLVLTAAVDAAEGTPIRSLIAVPGWLLENEVETSKGGFVVFTLDAKELRAEYPLVDTMLPHALQPGLADEFVWLLMSGEGTTLQVRRVVLFGPQLWNP